MEDVDNKDFDRYAYADHRLLEIEVDLEMLRQLGALDSPYGDKLREELQELQDFMDRVLLDAKDEDDS